MAPKVRMKPSPPVRPERSDLFGVNSNDRSKEPLNAAIPLPYELLPKGHLPDQIRNWISYVCERLDIAPTALAKRAGLAPSTINRFLSGNGPNKNISATTMSSLITAADMILREKFGPPASQGESRRLGSSTIRKAFEIQEIMVVGGIREGHQHRGRTWEDADRYSVRLPVPTIQASQTIEGFEVQDASIDTLYPQGSVVVCVPLDRLPFSGERLVLQRRLGDGLFETIAKEVRFGVDSEPWFVGLSTQPKYGGTISFEEDWFATVVRAMLIIGGCRVEPRVF